MKRILITGGAGYLGSVLSRKLLEKGYKVRVVDGLWYGKEPIAECLKNPNFELVQDDIRNLIVTVKALKEVDAASNATARTPEQVVQILEYVLS